MGFRIRSSEKTVSMYHFILKPDLHMSRECPFTEHPYKLPLLLLQFSRPTAERSQLTNGVVHAALRVGSYEPWCMPITVRNRRQRVVVSRARCVVLHEYSLGLGRPFCPVKVQFVRPLNQNHTSGQPLVLAHVLHPPQKTLHSPVVLASAQRRKILSHLSGHRSSRPVIQPPLELTFCISESHRLNWACTAAGNVNSNSSGRSFVAQAAVRRLAAVFGQSVTVRINRDSVISRSKLSNLLH